jgi:D-lactate dehydrogenase
MKIAVFSAKNFDRRSLDKANEHHGHQLSYFETRLNKDTTPLAEGFQGVAVFVNDDVCAECIAQLAAGGTRIICTRSAGFNQINLEAAEKHGVTIARVPAYSPNAISEFTVGLILTLGRKIHRAYNRVRDNNFELDGLQGFEIHDKTVAILGTGRIGAEVVKNLSGFRPRILAYDPYRNPEIEHLAEYVDDLDEIVSRADIITLHMPLTPDTYHLINKETLAHARDGVMIVNTSRGALIDTAEAIEALKEGKIGFMAIDVYEEEGDLFFQDLSDYVVQDDVFSRLLTFPNVLVTGHQAFLTDRALLNIAEVTLQNFSEFEASGQVATALTLQQVRGG